MIREVLTKTRVSKDIRDLLIGRRVVTVVDGER